MKKSKDCGPPDYILRFLSWFCPDHLFEEIEGDLIQKFRRDVNAFGERKAKRRFIWNVMRFIRPEIILRNKFSVTTINFIMIGNYFKVASRNILKRKLYSFINAVGLSIGIAFCILIYLFIHDERSFDQFHANRDRIYRMHGITFNGALLKAAKPQSPFSKLAHMQLGLAPVMKDELPEVEYATHFCISNGILRNEAKIFNESLVYVDADFFKMFSFRLISGNSDKIFQTKDEIVLTPELGKKYFGDQDPIGKTLILGARAITITGIIETPPANSSLNFKALLPIQGWGAYNQHNLDEWRNLGFPTFVQLRSPSDTANLQAKLERLTHKYMGDNLKEWRENENVPAEYKPFEIGYTQLGDIHFESEINWDKVSDPQYSWILGGIAMLILAMACINYISLALTTSARRRIEVGIRKAVGAFKTQLVFQFGVESIVLVLISMVLGMGVVWLFLPAFNDFTGKSINPGMIDFISLLGIALCLTLIIGFLAGSYPAFFLSRFRPAQVLKGTSTARMQAGFARPLVVIQFALSAFLIISSVIMYRQMLFMTTKDLGYNQHQIVVIPTQAGWREDSKVIVENFRKEAIMNPAVISVTATDNPFAGFDFMRFGYKVNGENKATFGYAVDPYFIKTMEIQLIEGRNFDINNIADLNGSIIVNESLVEDMKWKEPLKEHLNYHMSDTTGLGSRVIGVVKDFNFLSLEQKIEPMFLTMEGRLINILVKISPTNMPATVKHLEKYFSKVSPGKPFEYSFMDENVTRQYASFDRWMNIMTLSTGFAILISSLGLFGLAGINAVNRTKEIGIRKVMGAELHNIFMLLNKQFIWISFVSFVIAAPLSWYAMNEWLSHFQFRIALDWKLFAISMLAGLAVALLTVSYHSLKAASVNPADTLKYE